MAVNFTKMVSSNIQNNTQKDIKHNIIEMDPSTLIDDNDNREIYSDYDVALLAEDMKNNGVFGIIMAYPYQGKYRIESGHRRKYAAIKAGIKKFPVLITSTPKTETERRRRLVRANLHIRNYSTMTIAREADYMYETREMERKEMLELGIKPEIGSTELVAADLEISASQVSRYRKLLSLSPDLQKLLDNNDIPWSPLCEASELNNDQQKALYQRISGAIKTYGVEAISSSFLRKQIEECSFIKKESYKLDRNALSQYEATIPEKAKKVRRMNGASALKKGAQAIRDGLNQEKSYIKANQENEVLEELKALSAFVSEMINEIEREGFSENFKRKLK